MAITGAQREQHLSWLSDLTQVPTASGRESRVVRWVERWAASRPWVKLTHDPSGNLHLAMAAAAGAVPTGRPVYFTAHMDHPAFVVERIIAPGVLELSFRGGVMETYFQSARVAVFDAQGARFVGVLAGESKDANGAPAPGPFKRYLCELDTDDAPSIAVGDVCVWDLPAAEVIDGCLHTHACDDLAALVAALAAFDVLGGERAGSPYQRPENEVCVLLTRAEEIGFIGAIAACRHGTLPKSARVLALENSRAFPDSPIGGGPIVRVGDRISVFSPSLTDAVARRAEEYAGGPASVTASQLHSEAPAWRWQRKLMSGGACEASVFCDAGFEATCVCLPLGNYHNMGDLAAVQAGTNTARPAIEREFISVSDFHGLVDLLAACGRKLAPGGGVRERVEKLWQERRFVLDTK